MVFIELSAQMSFATPAWLKTFRQELHEFVTQSDSYRIYPEQSINQYPAFFFNKIQAPPPGANRI